MQIRDEGLGELAPHAEWDDGSRRVCTRCVMSTTDPDISFDADGRCNHCTDYLDRLANLTYRPGRATASSRPSSSASRRRVEERSTTA